MKRIHFIGIGGSGMSALALIAIQKGMDVSGSDIENNTKIEKLKKMGAKINIGHSRENISSNIDKVVYSSAIKRENSELVEAKKQKIKIEQRARYLAGIFENKKEIVVVGTHGKTTTTALGANVLIEKEGNKASYYIGGILKETGKNGNYGKGKWAVLELDESDGSFLNFNKDIALINNIELEHVAYYKNEKELMQKFSKFINNFKGKIYIEVQSFEKIKKLIDNRKNIITVGLDRGDSKPIDFGPKHFKVKEGKINLSLHGIYNTFNSYLLYTALMDNGFDFMTIKKGLETFTGVKRRQEIIYENDKITLIDDYGHHPTEIKNTFKSLKENFKYNNRYVLFQPHRYSRFKYFKDEFQKVITSLDATVIILPVYSASEENDKKINSYSFYKKVKKIKNSIYYAENLTEGFNVLISLLRNDSLVVSFGAGDVNQILKMLKSRLIKKEKKGLK
ncbi:MAG: UDP-N-acetylmuramate--L-alanine ligase [Candidatus Mcinerneyibacterium aminivorans]|uniref:UDP-N-acetylmuramate--L-alanine ligase n=1 Tax=Candidatus Mcinerneyibacterium aminivorans TaxID=2703815 RepID=A0A5D0MGG5_9BACT|nr:MAG: UDP-N-acetylmuramate--L-alanine ligase [Candidatus Mcinerneyibacterium aminivorans]